MQLENLPNDVLREIIRKMTLETMLNYCKTNTRMSRLCDEICIERAKEEFGVDITKDKAYKETFNNYLAAGVRYYENLFEEDPDESGFAEKADQFSTELAKYLRTQYPDRFKFYFKELSWDKLLHADNDHFVYATATQNIRLKPDDIVVVSCPPRKGDWRSSGFVIYQTESSYEFKRVSFYREAGETIYAYTAAVDKLARNLELTSKALHYLYGVDESKHHASF
jgi:hypothetical protein